MEGDTVARNYAEALFELAQREGAAAEYGAALDEVASLVGDVPQLRQFLETPRIERSEKTRILKETLGDRIPTNVLNFLLLVLQKGRQRRLGAMAIAYRDLLNDSTGRAHVEVSVARPVGPEEEAEITRHLSTILGREAIPHFRVEPGLLGGIAFRSGDTIFDGSVRRRLQRMRQRLLAADVSTT
ncbi:MAG: ATP synthase F1 subunit delta [Gemmatimonadota bacterium]